MECLFCPYIQYFENNENQILRLTANSQHFQILKYPTQYFAVKRDLSLVYSMLLLFSKC
jgi:hypothetical protein